METRLKDNEEHLRDLFDEAPIAYVHEGLDTRFIRANRAAMRSLGITPDEVHDTYGSTFIPETSEAQCRLKGALESIGRARIRVVWCSNSAERTMGSHFGFSVGQDRTPAGPIREPCLSISPRKC